MKVLDRHNERDKETFDTFLDTLPVTGGIHYITQKDMAAGLKFDHIQELYGFVDYCNGRPDFFFIDRSLEKKRKTLVGKIHVFLQKLSSVTETIRDEPLIIKMPQQHLFDDPNRWREIRDELNQETQNIHKIYSSIILEAKKKL